MIRIALAAAAALTLAACSKAPEDVTAHYALAGKSDAMTIKAAGNGDARVDLMGATLIRKGGTEYLVSKDQQGEFAATIEDFAAAAAEVMKAKGITPKAPPAQPEYNLNQSGDEEIAGLKGKIWKVEPKDKTAGPTLDAVIADDRAYDNVGKALAMQTHLDSIGMKQMTGSVGNLEKRVEEMLGKGMVLRFGTALKLEKVEKTPFKTEDFALPKAVLDRKALTERFKAMMAAMPPLPPSGGAAPAPGGEQPAPMPAPAPGGEQLAPAPAGPPAAAPKK